MKGDCPRLYQRALGPPYGGSRGQWPRRQAPVKRRSVAEALQLSRQ